MENSNKSIVLDPKGDILLLLSSRDGEQSIKVSSKSLSLASSVFATMFCPDSPFLEGSQLKQGSETRIKLDDDFDALTVVLRAIHFQNKHVPLEVSFKSLCDVATVSDKYNLAESVLPWYEIWAVPLRKHADVKGYERWLFVSYVFADAKVFKIVSRQLILHIKINLEGDLLVDSGVQFDEGVPDSIIESIEDKRHGIIKHLVSKAEDEVEGYSNRALNGRTICQRPKRREECDSINFGALLRGLIVAGLWPHKLSLPRKSVMDLSGDLESVENFGSDIIYHLSGVYGNHDNHEKCGSKVRFSKVIADLTGSVKGLSLAEFCPETVL